MTQCMVRKKRSHGKKARQRVLGCDYRRFSRCTAMLLYLLRYFQSITIAITTKEKLSILDKTTA